MTALAAVAFVPTLLGGCSISPGDQVGITMREWSITLSPATVRSGRVRLAIDSVGTRKHDLALMLAKDVADLVRGADGKLDLAGANRPIDEIKAFEPGHYIALSPNLLAGHYLVICTLTSVINGQPVDHLNAGMVAKLIVTERQKKAT